MLIHPPPRLMSLLDSNLTATVALERAAKWAANGPEPMLVIQGDTGSGKSVAAAWAMRFVSIRRSRGVQYGLGDRVDPLWCDARVLCQLRPWDEQWAKFDASPLVVIDDVGTEDKPATMVGILERIFNLGGGKSILTTNLDAEAFTSQYGSRVASRIAGFAQWFATSDPDMRIDAPRGEPFPLPGDLTQSEKDAAERRREERAREDEEAQRYWAEHSEDIARHRAELRRLTSDRKTFRIVEDGDDESDNARRQELAAQLEELKKREELR